MEECPVAVTGMEGCLIHVLDQTSGRKRRRKQDSYCSMGRYEFLIDGVWVDEASPVNVLEEGKSGIVALSE